MKNHVFKIARLVLLTAAGLMMTQRVIFATPSTIIWIPSADFQGFNSWHLGIDNFIRIQKDDNRQRGAGIYDFGITTGILPFKKVQEEVGIDYLSMGDALYDDYPIYFNAKIGMPESALFKNSPAIVFGGFNFGLKKNLTNYNVVYGLIAKTLPFIGRLSAGYYNGNKRTLTGSNGSKSNSGVLLSWDRSMKEISDKLWFAVDYQGAKNYMGSLNFGVSWAFSDKVSVIVGYDIYNDPKGLYNSTDASKNAFTTQLDINF